MMDAAAFVQCDNLVKIYKVADPSEGHSGPGLEAIALQGLNLKLAQGEMMALIGPSGVGKSTLLNVIGALDTPSAGSVSVAGWDLLRMKDRERVQYKRQVVGFVWQQPARNLLPYLSARENVELPMQHNGVEPRARHRRALELLDLVGLADRAGFRPEQLSGGEQQRVAIARALVKRPTLILADEPTGQLDTLTGAGIIALLKEIATQAGVTVVVASHNPNVHETADRIFELKDGRLVEPVDQRG